MASAPNVALIQVHDSRGRLLLGKRRDNGTMTLPGGHLNPGESPEDGAARELFEETGLKAESLTMQRVVEPTDGRPRLYCFTALCIGEPHGQNDPDQEVDKWEFVDIDGGIPEKFWDNLTGPQGDDNIVRQAYEPEGAEDLDKSEDDLAKFQPTPVFPKLGVPEDRREVPIVDTPAELRSKARALVSAEPFMSRDLAYFDSKRGVNRQYSPEEVAENRNERGRAEFNNPSAGMVTTNPAYTTGYSLSNALRDTRGMTDKSLGINALPQVDPNAPLATQLHENWHQVMNRIQSVYGHQKRAYLARNLYLSIPDEERRHTDWFTSLRNQRAEHGKNPFHPHHYEEKIAALLNYLSNPGEREAYHGFLDHSPEERTRFDRSIKRALKHIRRTAADADESWMDPAKHPLTYEERMSPDRPIERPTMSKPALPPPVAPKVAPQPTPKKPPAVDPRQQKLFEKSEPTYADYLEEPTTNMLEDDLQKMAVLPPDSGYTFHIEPQDRLVHGCDAVVSAVAPGSSTQPTYGTSAGLKDFFDRGGVGYLKIRYSGKTPRSSTAYSDEVYVHPDHRRKGVASAMYGHAEKMLGVKMVQSTDQTAAGKELWRGNKQVKQFGKSEGEPLVIQGYGMPGTYFEGEPCMYDSAEDCPDIDCSHHAEVKPLQDPTDPNGGETESEVAALLRHPDPQERALALKLSSCSPQDVTTAAFDADPVVWQQALAHPLAAAARHAVAMTTTGPNGTVWGQHDAILKDPSTDPSTVEAMHQAVSSDPHLDEGLRQSRLTLVAAHPSFGAMAKHDVHSAANIYHSSTQPDLAPADASAEVTLPHLKHLEEAYRHHAPKAPPLMGKEWRNPSHLDPAGGASDKEVYKLPVAGFAEPRRFMVKPYSERWSPLSGWAEASSQALYHAAGIGHLHQQSFVAPHGHGDTLVPATVIHLEDADAAGKEAPASILQKNPDFHSDLRKIALMDLLTSNVDRHGGNLLVRPDGKPLAIDHGMTFNGSQIKNMPRSYLNSGGIHAAGGNIDPKSYADTWKWWSEVAPAVKHAFNKRLELIRDQDVRANSLRKVFGQRANWLDTAAKTSEAGYEPDFQTRFPGGWDDPLAKKIDDSFLQHGEAAVPLGDPMEGTAEHLMGKHPASIQAGAQAFHDHVLKPGNTVKPVYSKATSLHRPMAGEPGSEAGMEAKQVYHTPGGAFMVKAFHALGGNSAHNLASGWNEAGSQALYHAAGIGHLHQASHVAMSHSGAPATVVHMAPNHLTWDQLVGGSDDGRGGKMLENPQHMESLRRIGFMDHILDNRDRHGSNLMVGPEGQPLAIDSGNAFYGHHYDDNPAGHHLTESDSHARAIGGAPTPETMAWWQRVKPAVKKAWDEHIASVPDDAHREKLRRHFRERVAMTEAGLAGAQRPVQRGVSPTSSATTAPLDNATTRPVG